MSPTWQRARVRADDSTLPGDEVWVLVGPPKPLDAWCPGMTTYFNWLTRLNDPVGPERYYATNVYDYEPSVGVRPLFYREDLVELLDGFADEVARERRRVPV